MPKPLRPFFPYFGAKWRLAPHYPAPIYDTVIEPYAGSACYSLHHHDRKVVLCEAYAPVAAIWRYLIHEATPERILSLPDLGDRSVDDFDLAQAEKWLIGYWVNPGVARPRKTMTRWAHDKPSGGWSPTIRDRIASQLPLVKHWTILEGRYEEVSPVGLYTYFIDPPYVGLGHHYGVGKDADYAAIAADCRGLTDIGAQVIVCEAAGADWLPFRPFREARAKTHTAGLGRYSKEVIWP